METRSGRGHYHTEDPLILLREAARVARQHITFMDHLLIDHSRNQRCVLWIVLAMRAYLIDIPDGIEGELVSP